MIVYPAEHLFQAKYPVLEPHEEEIFYHHPVEEIYCNQLGVLYYDEGVYSIYDKNESKQIRQQKTGRNIGSKMRVIWECYVGQIVSCPHFLYVNGNPLDTRFENIRKTSELSPKGKEWAELQKTKKKFIQKTVEYLLKLEARAEKVGMDKEQLYQVLMLPSWIIIPRKKLGEAPVKITRVPGPKSWTTEEQADQIERMYLQGLSYYAIIDRFGWTSTHRVKKVVRDRKLKR